MLTFPIACDMVGAGNKTADESSVAKQDGALARVAWLVQHEARTPFVVSRDDHHDVR